MDSICVAIRVRAFHHREANQSQQLPAWSFTTNNITQLSLSNGKPINSYNFDYIYTPDEPTQVLFDGVAKGVVKSAMGGINGTIFAYGQTSSGKTFTMQGSGNSPGIIPLAIKDIFSHIEACPNREFLLRVSYLEIYNEKIQDLLSNEPKELKIHEDTVKGVYVGGSKEAIVVSPEQMLQLMKSGEERRHIGTTNMNEHSSRSHTIFRTVIESRERSVEGNRESMDGVVKVSMLNLVDLAGSERLVHTGSEGIRLKEGSYINKSLLALGSVIAKLSEGQKQHIPYRDSKLTRILQTALGGNALTTVICTITPAAAHQEETCSTLKFATRAKNIKNKPVINEVVDEATMLRKYKDEIHALKQQLAQRNEQKVDSFAKDELETLKSQLNKLKGVIIHSSLPSQTTATPRRLPRRSWCPGEAEADLDGFSYQTASTPFSTRKYQPPESLLMDSPFCSNLLPPNHRSSKPLPVFQDKHLLSTKESMSSALLPEPDVAELRKELQRLQLEKKTLVEQREHENEAAQELLYSTRQETTERVSALVAEVDLWRIKFNTLHTEFDLAQASWLEREKLLEQKVAKADHPPFNGELVDILTKLEELTELTYKKDILMQQLQLEQEAVVEYWKTKYLDLRLKFANHCEDAELEQAKHHNIITDLQLQSEDETAEVQNSSNSGDDFGYGIELQTSPLVQKLPPEFNGDYLKMTATFPLPNKAEKENICPTIHGSQKMTKLIPGSTGIPYPIGLEVMAQVQATPKEKDIWFDATIMKVYPATKKHKVKYKDGGATEVLDAEFITPNILNVELSQFSIGDIALGRRKADGWWYTVRIDNILRSGAHVSWLHYTFRRCFLELASLKPIIAMLKS